MAKTRKKEHEETEAEKVSVFQFRAGVGYFFFSTHIVLNIN